MIDEEIRGSEANERIPPPIPVAEVTVFPTMVLLAIRGQHVPGIEGPA